METSCDKSIITYRLSTALLTRLSIWGDAVVANAMVPTAALGVLCGAAVALRAPHTSVISWTGTVVAGIAIGNGYQHGLKDVAASSSQHGTSSALKGVVVDFPFCVGLQDTTALGITRGAGTQGGITNVRPHAKLAHGRSGYLADKVDNSIVVMLTVVAIE